MKSHKEVTEKDIEWLLNLHRDDERDEAKPPSSTKRKRTLTKILSIPLLLILLGVLPFFLLIRTAAYFHSAYALNGWLALGGGVAITILLLALYLFLLFRRVQNKQLLLKSSLIAAGGLTMAFCLFALFTLSASNAKTEEVRSLYRTMHPVLRVAVSTLTLADGDLVVTDIRRTEEDYERMGLPVFENSLHFEQENGYVHAVDLRTIGQSEFRNLMLEYSFRLLGFRTLRHTGTADHLHVEIAVVK
jgi:hypothetical protein